MNYIELDEIDSTNEYVKRNINDLTHFSIVRCNFQTNGRGRSNHVWQSSKDNNLLMSILLKDFNNPTKLHQLTQVIACSIIKVLKAHQIDGLIKWPNDIYVNNLKICGILIEAIYEGNNLQGVIIGVGLNINEISEIFQSMRMVTGKKYDIKIIMDEVIECFKEYYLVYCKGEYKDILQRANKLSYLSDRLINYDKYGLVKFEQLNEDGTITIKDSKNRCYQIFINEISLSK